LANCVKFGGDLLLQCNQIGVYAGVDSAFHFVSVVMVHSMIFLNQFLKIL
jgi:hypothetical protein